MADVRVTYDNTVDAAYVHFTGFIEQLRRRLSMGLGGILFRERVVLMSLGGTRSLVRAAAGCSCEWRCGAGLR